MLRSLHKMCRTQPLVKDGIQSGLSACAMSFLSHWPVPRQRSAASPSLPKRRRRSEKQLYWMARSDEV